MEELQILRGEFGSVEEYALAVAPSGWEIDFCQLDRRPGRVTVRQLDTGSSVLMYTGLEGRVHQRAVPPAGRFTCAFLAEEQAPFKISKRSVEPRALLSIDRSASMDGVSEANFSGYSFSLCENRMTELAERAGLQDPASSGVLQGVPHYVSEASLDQMRRLIGRVQARFNPRTPAECASVTQLLDSDIPLEILRMLGRGDQVNAQRPSARRKALQRAMDYINQNPQTSISVEMLCSYAACSLSTLERAFREHFGVLPRQYLTALRLGGVRRVLLNPQDTRTIGDVAADWGFWHLSKFSADYKRMFGELPSKTRALA